MSQSDGIDETIEQMLQHGMSIAAQLGREVARTWQKRLEEKARMNSRDASRLQLAFDSEKRTALALLKPTQEKAWWDAAKPGDVIDAYRVANAWKNHAPEAEQAEKTLREQAEARFGIDGQELLRRSQEAVVPQQKPLSEKEQFTRDLLQAKEHFSQSNPERLREYENAVRGSDHVENDIPHQKALIADWRTATGQEDPALASAAKDAEIKAGQERTEGDVQSAAAAAEYSGSGRDREAAAAAEFDGPNEAEEAWYRDTYLVNSPEVEEAQSKAADAKASGDRRERAGDVAAARAGTAYDSAERQEAMAARMRAAGAPERGIQARQFAESQQKYPIDHAAAGAGKTVNKVKTNSSRKSLAQGQTRQQSR